MGCLPVISLPTEVDAFNVHLLRDAVLEVCAESTSVVVVDMTATTFIDAAAIGVLLPLGKRLHDSGGELRLVVSGAQVQRLLVLEVIRMNRFSRTFPNLTEALATDRLHLTHYAEAA
jgi:anti-anti-sigma factor